MPTALDFFLPSLVSTLLGQFGGSVILTRVTATPDPDTLDTVWVTSAQTVRCTPPAPIVKELAPGGAVELGDLETLVAATDVAATVPQPGDLATFDGLDYRVFSVLPVMSGESVAAYRLAMRRGEAPA